jgi:transcriptional regulator with XRE-family HTH domain
MLAMKPMSLDQVYGLLAKRLAEAGSQKELARRIGCSTAYISDVLGRRRDPAERILDYLGLEPHTTYRPKVNGK